MGFWLQRIIWLHLISGRLYWWMNNSEKVFWEYAKICYIFLLFWHQNGRLITWVQSKNRGKAVFSHTVFPVNLRVKTNSDKWVNNLPSLVLFLDLRPEAEYVVFLWRFNVNSASLSTFETPFLVWSTPDDLGLVISSLKRTWQTPYQENETEFYLLFILFYFIFLSIV